MTLDTATLHGDAGATTRERTRFFSRQLVTPDDLTQDQVYVREKLRRHNRLLHGWGILCGAWVRPSDDDPGRGVVVEPGCVLGPFGDEIVIDHDVPIDVFKETLEGEAVSPCVDMADPWCSDVRVDRRPGSTLYLAVRYAECRTRPVHVRASACGCDEETCEYSRIRDSYALKVLTKLPPAYHGATQPPTLESIVACGADGRGRPCPPDPTDPWVILADITLDAAGKIAKVDPPPHRRYVASFAEFYFTCGLTAPGSLRVARVRVMYANDPDVTDPEALNVLFDSDSSSDYPVWLATGDDPNIVEIHFTGGKVDFASVENGGLEVRRARANDAGEPASALTPVPGHVVEMSSTVVRWAPHQTLVSGYYRVTLRGEDPTAVRSTEGARLDGELRDAGEPENASARLPSGDGTEGGTFSWVFILDGGQ
jgi:hypothetical protein